MKAKANKPKAKPAKEKKVVLGKKLSKRASKYFPWYAGSCGGQGG